MAINYFHEICAPSYSVSNYFKFIWYVFQDVDMLLFPVLELLPTQLERKATKDYITIIKC